MASGGRVLQPTTTMGAEEAARAAAAAAAALHHAAARRAGRWHRAAEAGLSWLSSMQGPGAEGAEGAVEAEAVLWQAEVAGARVHRSRGVSQSFVRARG